MTLVKVEMHAPKRQSEKNALTNEKQIFIDKIVSLKSQNQQLLLQLRNEQSENASVKLENASLKSGNASFKSENASLKSDLQKMKEESVIRSVEMKSLQSKLSEGSAKHTEICAQKDVQISNLIREKNLLEARNKQLQRGLDQRKPVEEIDEAKNHIDTDVYEVEKLLGHKMKNGIRFYLVRWKGYTEEDDTWEKESNLDCPAILKSYNQSVANKKK